MISRKIQRWTSLLFLIAIATGASAKCALTDDDPLFGVPLKKQETAEEQENMPWVAKQMERLSSAPKSDSLEILKAECGISSRRKTEQKLTTPKKKLTRSERNDEKKHARWLAQTLKRIKSIKPGVSRSQLLKVCTTEGGLSSYMERNYVYRTCPYLKVRVEFRPATNLDGAIDVGNSRERENDVIVKISEPFLQWSILD